MKYLQPFDYEHAAKLLIAVLHRERENLSDVQLYKLRKRAEQLMCTKKYKITQESYDRIVKGLPKRIRDNEFPQTSVDAKTIRR